MTQEKQRDYFFYLSLFNLFWVGMNCPDLSQGFFFLCTLIMLVMFKKHPDERISPFVLSVLILYLAFHYSALMLFGFIKPFQFFKEPLFLLACYAYGHFLGRSRVKDWPGGIILILLAMVSGFVLFAFLSVYMAPNVSMYAEQVTGQAKAGRTGIMIWTGQPGGFGPILGIQGNMGTAFLPVLIFGALQDVIKDRRLFFLLVMCAGVLIVSGLYTNVLLKNRGPFVIVAGIMAVLGAYTLIFAPSRLTPAKLTRKLILLMGFSGFILVLPSLMPDVNDLNHLGVVSRFTEEGGSSPRTEFWKNCIRVIGDHPLGGRKDDFGHDYAHNIWLDVGYDSGVIAMFFLIVFHCIHFKDMATLTLGRLPIPPGVICAMVAQFFIIFISLFTEPVGKGYTIYYAITFFYCGLLRRLVRDGLNLKKEMMIHEIRYRLRYAGRMPA